MTRLAAPLLALLLAAPVAWGQAADPPPAGPEVVGMAAAAPKVTLPKERRVAVGERFSIAPVVSNGGTPRLYLPDPGLREDRTFVDLLPEEYQAKLKGWVLYASAPGSFRVASYVGGPGNSCSEIAVCTVTVGDAPPAPPGPTPPGPTPPTPGDPLAATLAAAYRADGSPAASAKTLASLYRVAATSTVNDPALATAGDLLNTMSKAAAALVPLPALKSTREAIAAELKTKLPAAPSAPLDAPTRKLCADQFARVATLLESIAK
jgi:hypothetical protein